MFEALTPLIPHATAAVLGFIGGAIHYLAETDEEKKNFVKDSIGGALTGFVFMLTGLPNHLNTVLAGYVGVSLVRNLKEKFTK